MDLRFQEISHIYLKFEPHFQYHARIGLSHCSADHDEQ